MSTGHAGWLGYAPTLTHGKGNPEAVKYRKLWEMTEYRERSPGEEVAQQFLMQARPKPLSTCIDFGCGTGRGALMLTILGSLNVTMVDFVSNALDPEIAQACDTQSHMLRFVQADLEHPIPAVAEYGFCTDVMEHLPTEKVNVVLNNILRSAQHVFFQIAGFEDVGGPMLLGEGERLHLTVQPFSWWLERFKERECIVHYSEDAGDHYLFYVSAWSSGHDLMQHGGLNVTPDEIRTQVQTNISAGWQQVRPHATNDIDCMILGGGASLSDHLDEIRALRAQGVKLITMNGTYNWALDHGLVPSAQSIVDAREFNKRFTKPVHETCLYLLASRVHPTVLEGLPPERTFLFHSDNEDTKDLLDAVYPTWWNITGGSTVLTRSLCLLRTLGYRRFHLFGCDSCVLDRGHHAYAQAENDVEWLVPVKVSGGRIFDCHLWMAVQAQEFIDLIKAFGNEIELNIHGDGLLAHILAVAAAQGGDLHALNLEQGPQYQPTVT